MEVGYTSGIIRKSWKTSSFILDGKDGALIDIKKGLKRKRGFEDLIGLDETKARILIELVKAKEASVPELEERTGLSSSTLRKVIRELQDQRIVTYKRVGHANVYLPFRDIHVPKLGRQVEFSLPPKGQLSNPQECEIKEDMVRKALKGIEPTADLVRFEVFYYPVYIARYTRRKLEIDGVTGEVRELS